MTSLRVVLIGVIVLVAAACTQRGGTDHCRDHHLVHAGHLDSIGMLTLDVAADGTVTKQLHLPADLGNSVDISELITLQIEGEGRLRQIDVSILDQFPNLEEIEVTMSTTATQKRFAISRRCANPIFRLD